MELVDKSSLDIFLLREDFRWENIPPPDDNLDVEFAGDIAPSKSGLPVSGVDDVEALFEGGGDDG